MPTGTNNNQTKSAADKTTVLAAVAAAMAVATATGTGMATTTGMATDTAMVTAESRMAMLVMMVSMVTMVMMVMMAAAWKRLVAVAEVVVTGVAMAAATHLADYQR